MNQKYVIIKLCPYVILSIKISLYVSMSKKKCLSVEILTRHAASLHANRDFRVFSVFIRCDFSPLPWGGGWG